MANCVTVCSTLSSKTRKCSFSRPVTGRLRVSHTVTGTSTRLVSMRRLAAGLTAAARVPWRASRWPPVHGSARARARPGKPPQNDSASHGPNLLGQYSTPSRLADESRWNCCTAQYARGAGISGTMEGSRRWVFSSSRLAAFASLGPQVVRRSLPRPFFPRFSPPMCRVCDRPLEEISRIPVCRACLEAPAAFERGVLLRQLPNAISERLSPGCGGPLRAVPARAARFRRGLLLRILRRACCGS